MHRSRGGQLKMGRFSETHRALERAFRVSGRALGNAEADASVGDRKVEPQDYRV